MDSGDWRDGRRFGFVQLVDVTPQIGHGLDGFFCEVLKRIEGGIYAMHRRARFHLLGAFAERLQLFSFGRVELDISFAEGMLVAHDEEKNWPLEAESLVEFEVGN